MHRNFIDVVTIKEKSFRQNKSGQGDYIAENTII